MQCLTAWVIRSVDEVSVLYPSRIQKSWSKSSVPKLSIANVVPPLPPLHTLRALLVFISLFAQWTHMHRLTLKGHAVLRNVSSHFPSTTAMMISVLAIRQIILLGQCSKEWTWCQAITINLLVLDKWPMCLTPNQAPRLQWLTVRDGGRDPFHQMLGCRCPTTVGWVGMGAASLGQAWVEKILRDLYLYKVNLTWLSGGHHGFCFDYFMNDNCNRKSWDGKVH